MSIILITPNNSCLYLGGLNDVYQPFLDDHQITTVINMASECQYDGSEVGDHISFHYVPINDDYVTNITTYLDNVADLINSKLLSGSSVLVHCMMGLSRSVSMVLAYLIKYHSMPLKTAYQFVRDHRSILPNPHFMRQLMSYEQTVLHSNSCVSCIDEYVIYYIICALNIDNIYKDVVTKTYYDLKCDLINTQMALTRYARPY